MPTASSQIPTINFTFSPDKIKPGGSITITNTTANATFYQWSATPNTSVIWSSITASNPTVQFNQLGTYSINLIASNSFGTSSKYSNVFITVESGTNSTPPTQASTFSTPIDPKTVVSKIKLVKKSGPGELVGVVELDVIAGSVSFSGLQLSQGGRYTIEVIPTSSDLEKTEFNIDVEPEPSVIEQDKKPEEDKKESGDRPIITQIDDTNQKLQPLKREIQNNKDEAVESGMGMGLKPLIYYNGIEIARETQIKNIVLYYEDNIPRCKMTFSDSNGFIKDQPPRDDTKIELFLNSTVDLIKSIHLKFKIRNHKKNPDSSYYFEGTIDVDDLYVPSSKTYKGTSFEVLRKISKKLDLGFNSNIDNTDDDMKWINTNKEYKDFIKEIIEHSYKDDTTFLYGYIDFYYCLNYVDVEKEWKRAIDNDYMVETTNLDRIKKEERKLVPLVLTNEPSQRESCGYYQDFKVLNQSTATKLKTGYRTVTRYYDEDKKTMVEFEVDSQSSSDGTKHVLKGESGDNKFLDKKVQKRFLGKVDSENVHKNYNYAVEQNRKNLDNLTSIVCQISLPNINYNLYRLQKVHMLFYHIGSSPTSDQGMDHRYSGEWIIIDISFEMTSSAGKNKFTQKLSLARKELGKTPEEMKDDKKQAPESKDGNKNENQQTDQPKPNAKYKVGDKVQVVQTDGTKYEITVTNVLENGIEIEGTMKKV